MRKWLIFILAGILVAGLAGSLLIWGSPRVESLSPLPGAVSVAASAPVQIRFSRPMQPETVTENLFIDPPQSGSFTWQDNRSLTFTPDSAWPSGQSVQVQLSGGKAAGFPSLSLRGPISWSFTIGHPLIIYLYPANSAADIYSLDPLTGESRRLTQETGGVIDFDISRDGSSLFFNINQGNGGSTIYRLNRLTNKKQAILACPQALCRYPTLSPAGDMLAYERTPLSGSNQPDTTQVWLLPLDNTNASQDPQPGEPFLASGPDQKTMQPQWSPTGLLIYYNFTQSVFIVQDVQGREIARFPSQTGISGDWNPQGKVYLFPEIFANEISDPNTVTDLVTISSSHLLGYSLNGQQQDLTQTDDLEDTNPVYSPDGAQLVFARKYLDLTRWTPGRQLWLMQADGSQARQLTDEPYYNHYDFAWSPGGDQLVYTRFNKNTLTDPPEIWLMKMDGSLVTRLISGGYAPKWTP